MRRRRQDTQVFSISFLDVVCSAFGAIILVLVLSKTGEPRVLERVRADLSGVVADLQQQLFEIRGETRMLNRELQNKTPQLSESQQQLARLLQRLSDLKGEFRNATQQLETQRQEEADNPREANHV